MEKNALSGAPETGTILQLVRLMTLYQKSLNKAEFLETLQSFQSLIVNKEQQIYHNMLGENFEQQMEQLYAAFCEAFQGEEYQVFCNPDAFKTLMGLVGTNSQGIATSVLVEWAKKCPKCHFQSSDPDETSEDEDDDEDYVDMDEDEMHD